MQDLPPADLNNNLDVKKVELVDLVDSDGVIVKEGIPRNEIDQFPNLHMQIVIAVIFNDKGEVLVHRRALTKSVNRGDVDHVCGGVIAGESLESAAIREGLEETGAISSQLRKLKQGVNQYNRFRTLFVGEANQIPEEVDPKEAEWVKFMSVDELKAAKENGTLTFVHDFFDDLDTALEYRDL